MEHSALLRMLLPALTMGISPAMCDGAGWGLETCQGLALLMRQCLAALWSGFHAVTLCCYSLVKFMHCFMALLDTCPDLLP